MRFVSVWGGGSTVRNLWRGGRVNCLSWKNWKWCTRHSFERFFKALINLCLPIWLLLIWVRCRSTNVSLFSALTGRFTCERWVLPHIFSPVHCGRQNGSFKERFLFCGKPLKMDKPISKTYNPDSGLSVVLSDGENVWLCTRPLAQAENSFQQKFKASLSTFWIAETCREIPSSTKHCLHYQTNFFFFKYPRKKLQHL